MATQMLHYFNAPVIMSLVYVFQGHHIIAFALQATYRVTSLSHYLTN